MATALTSFSDTTNIPKIDKGLQLNANVLKRFMDTWNCKYSIAETENRLNPKSTVLFVNLSEKTMILKITW